jgi:hypothetical protein
MLWVAIRYIPFEKLDEASKAILDEKVNGPYLTLAFIGLSLYLMFLYGLPYLLGEHDVVKQESDKQ